MCVCVGGGGSVSLIISIFEKPILYDALVRHNLHVIITSYRNAKVIT